MLRLSLLPRLGCTLVSCFVGALLTTVDCCRAQYAEFRSKDYATGDSWISLLNGEVKGYRIEAHFFRADTHELCIVDEGDGKPAYGNLKAAMLSNSCVAGVNGGYFAANPERTPLGLLRHASRSIAPLSTGSFTVAGTSREEPSSWNGVPHCTCPLRPCEKPSREVRFSWSDFGRSTDWNVPVRPCERLSPPTEPASGASPSLPPSPCTSSQMFFAARTAWAHFAFVRH